MAITIHGLAVSTCTARVLQALVEKEVPYELITVDLMKGEHKRPAYLKLHPMGKVPVLEDDGFFLFESRAMAKYIAKKFSKQGTKLMPDESDLKSYSLFEQACSLEENYFNGPADGIAYEKVFKSMQGRGPTDEALVAKYAAQIDALLAAYDGILSKQKYLAGNELTLADLFHLPLGQLIQGLGYNELFQKYPNVDKWFKGLESRESWIRVQPHLSV